MEKVKKKVNGNSMGTKSKNFNGILDQICKKHRVSKTFIVCLTILILALVIVNTWFGLSYIKTITSRTVKFGLENIGQLATQAGYYTNVQVLDKSRQVWGIEVPFTQSNYVFSYDGIIKAGLDFASIRVSADELSHKITVKLPKVEILSNEIDEKSLRIYSDSKNIFTPLSIDDVNQAMATLKDESKETAVNNGILENAKVNAEILIKGFLSGSYDLQEYSIVFEWDEE